MAYRRPKRVFPTVQAWLSGTGTSQLELAKALNISQSHLCNILRGNRKPSADLAVAIAKLTNVAVETIIQPQKVA